jgi:hypothetical protein
MYKPISTRTYIFGLEHKTLAFLQYWHTDQLRLTRNTHGITMLEISIVIRATSHCVLKILIFKSSRVAWLGWCKDPPEKMGHLSKDFWLVSWHFQVPDMRLCGNGPFSAASDAVTVCSRVTSCQSQFLSSKHTGLKSPVSHSYNLILTKSSQHFRLHLSSEHKNDLSIFVHFRV